MSIYIALTNVPVPAQLHIRVRRRVKGRDNLTDVRIDASALGITYAGDWIAAVLLKLKAKSDAEGPLNGDLVQFLQVLQLVCADKRAKGCICQPIFSVGRKQVQSFFQHVERLVAGVPTWSGPTKSQNSSVFRRMMVENVPTELFAEDVGSHQRYFKTVLTERHKPRATLSDLPRADNLEPDPIGAIPHEDIQALREKTITRLESDIGAVEDACVFDLDYWGAIRKKIREYGAKRISRKQYQQIVDFVNGAPGSGRPILESDLSLEALLISFGRFEKDAAVRRAGLRTCFSKDLRGVITAALEISSVECESISFHHIVGLCINANPRELVAAFHILQIATGWNSDALLSMSINDIVPSDNGYLIRGLKAKVGKMTPRVFIGPSQRGPWLAVNLILWNHSQLKKKGHIEQLEERIWFCWSVNSPSDVMLDMYTMYRPKRSLLARHRLPWFSDEQIRNHVLTLVSMRRRNGLLDAQAIGGHSEIDTTAHYIEQFLSKLMCESINLEFQRRLDSTLKISIWGAHSDFVKRLRFQKYDENLAIPIGDGTLCASPEEPPDWDWLVGGTCDARRCHAGEGCKNNRLVVTPSSVQELWRFVQYYRTNWRRLLSENEASFREFHGPAMLFSFAFMDFLKNSLYWDEIKQYIPGKGAR